MVVWSIISVQECVGKVFKNLIVFELKRDVPIFKNSNLKSQENI